MDNFLLIWAALINGISKAGFGGGMGALVAPVLSLRMPGRRVIGLVLPMLLATDPTDPSDLLNCALFWGRWSGRHWLLVLPASAVGILVGARILRHLNDLGRRRLIGCVAVGFAAAATRARRQRGANAAPEWVSAWWLGVIMGFFAGILSRLAALLMQTRQRAPVSDRMECSIESEGV